MKNPAGFPLSLRQRWPAVMLALSALALVVGPVHFPRHRARALPPESTTEPALGDGPFAEAGVYPATDMQAVPPGLATRGSWVGSDQFLGHHETGWFRASRHAALLVAGFPTLPGNRLEIEVRRHEGPNLRLRFTGENVGHWQTWHLPLPADAEALRIIADDASAELAGWLGFSAPFTAVPLPLGHAWPFLQLTATTLLALTLLYGPGLFWFRQRTRPLHELALGMIMGPLLLAALGLLCWLLGGWFDPRLVARLGVALLLGSLAWRSWKVRTAPPPPAAVRQVVVATALLVGFAVAKANISFGPAGELYRDTVSRTLAVGGHSDSRISFHNVQLVARHFAPFGPEANAMYAPWTYASRGPLAGLIASPIVLATGADVPASFPDQAWTPFDPQGFAAYRIVLITLASFAGWAVFGTVTLLASPAWGLVAAITAMLSPFFVHEMYFTWPKLITAAWVLLAFTLAYRERPFSSGLALATGYLFHPLAILSAPFLGLWFLVRRPSPGWPARLRAAAACAAGIVLLVGLWQFVARFRVGEGGSQASFVTYFTLADGQFATSATWWRSRWDNFANTFIPGYALGRDPNHPSINSVYGQSDGWVRASFLYWDTLPFALGLPGFVLVAVGIGSALRHRPGLAFLTFVGPALFLVAYWGAASTGLMRHCGHVLFLSAIVLGVWGLQARGTGQRLLATFLHPATFVWRAGEIAVVAFGTTLLNQRPNLAGPFGWNDLVSLIIALGFLVAVTWWLARASRAFASEDRGPKTEDRGPMKPVTGFRTMKR